MKHIYLFMREGCPNCPAAKLVVEEVSKDISDLNVTIVDVDNMNVNLNYELLEQQIYIFSVPTVVIGNGGTLKVFSSGDIPDVTDLEVAIGG